MSWVGLGRGLCGVLLLHIVFFFFCMVVCLITST